MSMLPSKPTSSQDGARRHPFPPIEPDETGPRQVHMIVGRNPVTGADLQIAVTLDNVSIVTKVVSTDRQSWISRLTDRLNGYLSRVRREREIASAVSALSQMDDRSLSDIGVDRGGIEHIVRHGRPFD